MYLIKNHYHTICHFSYHAIQENPFVLTISPFKYLSKHEYTNIAAQTLLFHNELTILHTQQRNDVKVCTNTSKRGVSLCFPMYVCNL